MVNIKDTPPDSSNQSVSDQDSEVQVEVSQTPTSVKSIVDLSINEPETDRITTVQPTAGITPLQDPGIRKLSDLRLDQEYATEWGLNKQQVGTPVRRPNKQSFFRVHPSGEMYFDTMVLKLENEGQFYLIDKPLWASLMRELVAMRLYLSQTREGVVFFWPVRLPGEDGQLDPWNASAHEIARRAMYSWVRVISNRNLGAYEVISAANDFVEPGWPEGSLEEWLNLAFKDRIIQTLEHPVLKKLRGEM